MITEGKIEKKLFYILLLLFTVRLPFETAVEYLEIIYRL